MSDIQFKRYDESLREDLKNFLFEYSWNNQNICEEKKNKKFKWRYEESPYTNIPYSFIALDGDKIVGHRVLVPQKYKIGNDEFLFCIPTDSLVHPDYRRQGIFSRIVDFSRKELAQSSEIELIMSLSASEAATKAYIKYGYEPVGKNHKMFFVSPLNKLKKSKIDDLDLKDSITIDKEDNLEIEISKEFKKEDIARLASRFTDEEKIGNVRDVEFYNWRFRESHRDNFYVYCIKNNELVGYSILEKRHVSFLSSSRTFYMIMEYAYTNLDYLEEMIKTIKSSLSISAMMAFMFTRGKEEISILKKHGFKDSNDLTIKLLGRISKSDRILDTHLPGSLIQPVEAEINEDDFIFNGKDTRKETNWSLFKSDVH